MHEIWTATQWLVGILSTWAFVIVGAGIVYVLGGAAIEWWRERK
jgi:hypothetical protein